jgi:hypothetical protein
LDRNLGLRRLSEETELRDRITATKTAIDKSKAAPTAAATTVPINQLGDDVWLLALGDG